jgi:hypothetical protein
MFQRVQQDSSVRLQAEEEVKLAVGELCRPLVFGKDCGLPVVYEREGAMLVALEKRVVTAIICLNRQSWWTAASTTTYTALSDIASSRNDTSL